MSDDVLVIADIYNIPPWISNPAYNTLRHRWRWRLRIFRPTWLKNKSRYG